MRLFLAIVACFLWAHVVRGEGYTVRVQETAVLEIPGATAAYTTNPAIADVAIAAPGRVAVTGYSSGTTQLVIITASGSQSFLVTIAATARPALPAPNETAALARYEGRYSTGSAQVQNAVDLITNDGPRRSEFHILHIRDLRVAGDPSDSIASIFYRHTSPDRRLTLLDEMVDVSRMTVSNTQVRGLHLQQGPLEVHAGYASSMLYDGFFLHSDRRWVGGAGYEFDRASTRWTPSIYGFFSEPARTAARRGVVGALTMEQARGDTLLLRGDVGISRSLAASGEIRQNSPRSQLRGFLSFKPDNFPTLGFSDLPGTRASLDWTRRPTDRLSIISYGAFDRFKLAGDRQMIGAASVVLQYALTSHLSVLSGVDASAVRNSTTSIRTTGLPFGVAYDRAGWGFAARYRLLESSAASRTGDSLRLSTHARRGRFFSSAWAERQRQAPTLDLIFSAEPGLELALLRLGISVRTPEDVGRALRDNAALIDLGFISGINVNLTPRRLQAGVNLGWLGSSARSDHLRLLTLYGLDEGISQTRERLISTLTYSRRIFAATDLYGSYSWWRTSLGDLQFSDTSVDIGVRQQFTALPNFLRRSGTIEGFVFLDPEMSGVRGEKTSALPEIVVTLDSARTERTDVRGAYAFDNVPPGPHRVAVQLPAAPRAFFTTPSHSEVSGASHVDFGLVWAAARIDGRVMSDASEGVEGVVLSAVAPNGTAITATSDPEGRFAFAVPPGTFRIAVSPESIPPGYSIAGAHERELTVEADQPQSTEFEVKALRTLSGRAVGASEVTIESIGRTARVDGAGNFVFRSMPAGTFKLSARIGGRNFTSDVTLPAEPAMIQDLTFNVTPAGRASATSPAVASTAPLDGQHGTFRVAAGAFRSPANALLVKQRIDRLGSHAEITRGGALDLVTVGPFSSREGAEAEAFKLRTAGVEAVVITHRTTPVAVDFRDSRRLHVVQTGAFREERNARRLLGLLQRRGENAFIVVAQGLSFVYVGPFATRLAALAASERLQRAQVAGFVTQR